MLSQLIQAKRLNLFSSGHMIAGNWDGIRFSCDFPVVKSNWPQIHSIYLAVEECNSLLPDNVKIELATLSKNEQSQGSAYFFPPYIEIPFTPYSQLFAFHECAHIIFQYLLGRDP